MSVDEAHVLRGELAEISAWEDVWDAAPADVREELVLSRERSGSVAVFRSAFPWWFFRRIVGLGVEAPADRAWVDGQLDRLSSSAGPHGVTLCSDARPEALPTWLVARGLARTTTLAKMVREARDLPGLASTHAAIERLSARDASRFASATAAGFGVPASVGSWFGALAGRPRWHLYLASDEGVPVASAALFVEGDVGWLGFGSVAPSHRGRGLHGALMGRRMVDAAALGCRWLVTETNLPRAGEPAPSLATMRSHGFSLAYTRQNYVREPAAAT